METDLKLKLLVTTIVGIAFAAPVLFWFILNPETFWEKLVMLLVHIMISSALMAVTSRIILHIMEMHNE